MTPTVDPTPPSLSSPTYVVAVAKATFDFYFLKFIFYVLLLLYLLFNVLFLFVDHNFDRCCKNLDRIYLFLILIIYKIIKYKFMMSSV